MSTFLPRLQLAELEDLAWFPARIRDLSTDYLEYLESRLGLAAIVAPRLREALRASGTDRVVDLCSGGGGPVAELQVELTREGPPVRFVLTDWFPNRTAFERITAANEAITFCATPVDARRVPRDLAGLRTLFNAFHHFAPPDARAILAAAAKDRAPIAIFELSERSLRTLLSLLLMPLAVWLGTPFLRPFSWDRLLWTYVIPLVPLTCLWDGLVSQWRSYSPRELRGLVSSLGATGFRWNAGVLRHPFLPANITYLIGVPDEPHRTTG
ncbi:MAG: class I SAM-dependent methyltransferase [Gemmatimonadota bacterium]|nr:class I SAM-dependent methyltransferase [Gemmatimonadota bacterium]